MMIYDKIISTVQEYDKISDQYEYWLERYDTQQFLRWFQDNILQEENTIKYNGVQDQHKYAYDVLRDKYNKLRDLMDQLYYYIEYNIIPFELIVTDDYEKWMKNIEYNYK